jgi:CheY-like chemotaxis protein
MRSFLVASHDGGTLRGDSEANMRTIKDGLIGEDTQDRRWHPCEPVLSPPEGERRDAILTPGQPPELLLVDDDRETTELLAEAFGLEGYRVRLADDGQKGLACVDAGYPSLVVLDVEMPRLTGPEMAFQMFLKDLGREKIPIVLCSGVLNLAGIASQVGTPYFLAKPYTLDAMMNLVVRALVERTPPIPHLAKP